MAGNAELSHRKDIERRMQFLRDLIRYWNASAWQSKHNHVGTISVVGQFVREEPPGVAPVFENLFEHDCPCARTASFGSSRNDSQRVDSTSRTHRLCHLMCFECTPNPRMCLRNASEFPSVVS